MFCFQANNFAIFFLFFCGQNSSQLPPNNIISVFINLLFVKSEKKLPIPYSGTRSFSRGTTQINVSKLRSLSSLTQIYGENYCSLHFRNIKRGVHNIFSSSFHHP